MRMVDQTMGALRLGAKFPMLLMRTGWRLAIWGLRTGDELLSSRLAPDRNLLNDIPPPTPYPEVSEWPEPQEAPPSLDDLAIPDIDHLTVPSLRSQIRRLDAAQLHDLRSYEVAHAHRQPVLTAIDNRLAAIGQEGESHAQGADKGRAAVPGTTP